MLVVGKVVVVVEEGKAGREDMDHVIKRADAICTFVVLGSSFAGSPCFDFELIKRVLSFKTDFGCYLLQSFLPHFSL